MSPAAALAAAAPLRPGGPGDAVAGVQPSYVASPSSVAQVSAVLAAAAEHSLAVVATGTGSKLDWGAPPRRLDVRLDLAGLAEIIDHTAGDMVVQVQAGAPLGRLAERVRAAGQQLALDLPDQAGTVGGAIAVGAAGPRRLRYGRLRDLLLGLTVVRADGVVFRTGGRVVKNVAGYDLGKLICGSYGTLGVIVSATLRLHPVPAATGWVMSRAGDPEAAQRGASALLASALAPSAVELDWPDVAGPVTVAVLFEGTREGVAARVTAARALVDGVELAGAPDWFGRFPGSARGTRIEVSAPPATLAAALRLIGRCAAAGSVPVTVRGSAGGAVLQVGAPAQVPAAALGELLSRLRSGLAAAGGRAVVVHTPLPLDAATRWGPVEPGVAELMRRVKDQFDPGHRLAPGRFAAGI